MPLSTFTTAALLALGFAAVPALADRPGPDLLYRAPATAPQLANAGPWHAAPILISGTTAYRKGEFLYQDFLYDDHGAQETLDPGDTRTAGNLFSKPNGTYTYPTDARYAADAADIVELRIKPLLRATAFRLTLNTLKDPSLIAFTIALGSPTSPSRPLPFGANVSAPADVVLTVHPGSGKTLVPTLTNASGAAISGPAATVAVNRKRRQIDVRIPHATWDPARKRMRVAAGIGLWDAAAKKYLLPQGAADATHPGGGTGTPAAFFNVAYRTHEDLPSVSAGTDVVASPAWWRDKRQGAALARGDISKFSVDVDFKRLAKGVTDNRHVPKTGPMDRILASHFETGQGTDFSQACIAKQSDCTGSYTGNLQPYAIYIPKKHMAQDGYGMTLLLHSLSAPYNQYLGTRNQSQFGERGNGSIVITPEGRGPDGFYESYGAADVFEVWADVAKRFKLDRSRTVITGYSMGGFGTFKLGAQFPDLFARAQPTVGQEMTSSVLASLRNVPVLMWNTNGDELVPNAEFTLDAQALDRLGYRYELDTFQPCANAMCSPLFPNHLELAVNDQYSPAASFLDDATVDSNPAHVTYVVEASRSHKELGVVGDHAYWVSGLTLRGGTEGTIDAISHASGAKDPESVPLAGGSGTLSGGNLGPLLFTRSGRTWNPVEPGPKEDRLEITATNIAKATIDVKRVGLTCAAKVDLVTDGPISVTLNDCNKTVTGG